MASSEPSQRAREGLVAHIRQGLRHKAHWPPATLRYQNRVGAHTWDEWSDYPELVIEYVNTFRVPGEHA